MGTVVSARVANGALTGAGFAGGNRFETVPANCPNPIPAAPPLGAAFSNDIEYAISEPIT